MSDRAWVARSALALLFTAAAPLVAQVSGAAAQQQPPADPAANWTIGVTSFRGTNLSEDNLYLEQSLPLLILDALSGAQRHHYTIAELAAYQAKLVHDARTAAELTLSDLYAKRSALFYAQGTSAGAVAPGASGAPPAAPSNAAAPGAAPASSATGTGEAGASPAATTTTATTTSTTTSTSTTTTAAAASTSGATTPAAGAAGGAVANPFAQSDALIQQTLGRIKYLDSLDPSLITVADPKPIAFQSNAAVASAYAPAAGAPTTAPGPAAAPGAAATPSGASAPPAAAGGQGGTPSAAGGAPGGAASGAAAGGDQLLPYPLVPPGAAAQLDKVDFLVSGTITEVEGYLMLTVAAYSTALGKTIYSYKTALAPNNAFAALEAPIESLTTLVLGRPWAALNLTVDPSSALVYIDGSFYGVGSLSIGLMDAGRHVIRIVAPGFEDQTQELVLAPYENKKLAVTLSSVRAVQLVLTTFPAGADVYLDSQWSGRTPLLIDRPDRQVAATIKKKDYDDYTLTLSPESPAQVIVHLSSSVLNRADYVRNLRDRFYGSFGAFALSLALPVSLYSLTQDYATIYQESPAGSTEEKRLKDLTTVWYYSYLGGAFVSVSLFVNMVIDILDYLRASS